MSKLAGSQSQSKPGHPSEGFQCEHLGHVVEEFRDGVKRGDFEALELIFFGETMKMDSLGSYVVDGGQEVLPVENVGTAENIEGNHISMCKYGTRDCDGYQSVRRKLQPIVDLISGYAKGGKPLIIPTEKIWGKRKGQYMGLRW
jgi:hypothetical protein